MKNSSIIFSTIRITTKLQIATVKTNQYSTVEYSCKFIPTSEKTHSKIIQVTTSSHIPVK